jgi:hypothetical protein
VPILLYGPDNNFARFKEALSLAAIEKYGVLRRLIDAGRDWENKPPDPANYDFENDPYGMNLYCYKVDLKLHRKALLQHKEDSPKLYATICDKLSDASLDQIKLHPKYAEFNRSKDPLELWFAITELHQPH